MIASRDGDQEGEMLHGSFSVRTTELAQKLGPAGFLNRSREIFQEYFRRVPDAQVVVTRKGVVHLFCELKG